jgi:hypothetical protein
MHQLTETQVNPLLRTDMPVDSHSEFLNQELPSAASQRIDPFRITRFGLGHPEAVKVLISLEITSTA